MIIWSGCELSGTQRVRSLSIPFLTSCSSYPRTSCLLYRDRDSGSLSLITLAMMPKHLVPTVGKLECRAYTDPDSTDAFDPNPIKADAEEDNGEDSGEESSRLSQPSPPSSVSMLRDRAIIRGSRRLSMSMETMISLGRCLLDLVVLRCELPPAPLHSPENGTHTQTNSNSNSNEPPHPPPIPAPAPVGKGKLRFAFATQIAGLFRPQADQVRLIRVIKFA